MREMRWVRVKNTEVMSVLREDCPECFMGIELFCLAGFYFLPGITQEPTGTQHSAQHLSVQISVNPQFAGLRLPCRAASPSSGKCSVPVQCALTSSAQGQLR